MRNTEIHGFTVYIVHKGTNGCGDLFQRGNLLNLDKARLQGAFLHHNIHNVVGLARIKQPELQELHDEEFINYDWYKIPDNKISDVDAKFLLDLAAEIALDTLEGASTLCYCNAGRNRSALMNALILRSITGFTGKQTIEVIRAARPNSLANEHFVHFLESLG